MASTTYVDSVTLSSAAEWNKWDTAAYAALTGVAGTNTITATGPANLGLVATNPPLWFIPSATNTGATTINITPSGGAALGAKNIYFNGAACAGGEIVSGVPCAIVYDGTQFNIVGPTLPATQAQQEAGTSLAVAVTPGRQQFHPSAAKGWCEASATGGITGSYNVASVTDTGTGDANIVWDVDFSADTYAAVYCPRADAVCYGMVQNTNTSAAQTRVRTFNNAGNAVDPDQHMIVAFGDQPA